jgi:hypothetical protein
MKDSDTITIYWSPFAYDDTAAKTWAHLYQDPICLTDDLRKNKSKISGARNLFSCPAVTSITDNTFVFKNSHEAIIDLPMDDLIKVADTNEHNNEWINTSNKLALGIAKTRPSSLNEHVNLIYNMQWSFFADEPVIARQIAPYMPPHSPGKGVLLASGEYDIGTWFRPINLDYHVPFYTKTLSFKEDDPLFYLEVQTEKQINFKRFILSKRLTAMATEFSESPNTYGAFKSLLDRYKMAKKASVPEQVLAEIKNNLV